MYENLRTQSGIMDIVAWQAIPTTEMSTEQTRGTTIRLTHVAQRQCHLYLLCDEPFFRQDYQRCAKQTSIRMHSSKDKLNVTHGRYQGGYDGCLSLAPPPDRFLRTSLCHTLRHALRYFRVFERVLSVLVCRQMSSVATDALAILLRG